MSGWSDRVEAFADLIDTVKLHQSSVLEFVTDDNPRHQGDSVNLSGKQAQHCHVGHLCDDLWPDSVLTHQNIEASPDVALHAWKHHADSAQGFRKTEFLVTSMADENDLLITDQMVLKARLGIRGHRQIGKNQIDGVCIEHTQQVAQGARPKHQFDIAPMEKWSYQLELEVPGECGDRPDTQDLPLFWHSVLERVVEFFACSENGFRIVESYVARLRQE